MNYEHFFFNFLLFENKAVLSENVLIKLSCRFYTFDRNKLLFGSWVSRGGVVAGRIPSRKAAKLVYGLRKSKGCSDLASKQAASVCNGRLLLLSSFFVS